MKNLFAKSIIFVTLLAAFNSCSGGGGEIISTTPLTVSEKTINTSVLGETKTITVEAPSDWKATTTRTEWISITPTTGNAGVTDVKITIKDNNSGKSRMGEVRFTAGEESIKINVLQGTSSYFILPC